MKVCHSCAGTEADGAVFPPKERGRPRMCWDCTIEERRARPVLDQIDIVDMVRTKAHG